MDTQIYVYSKDRIRKMCTPMEYTFPRLLGEMVKSVLGIKLWVKSKVVPVFF
jgi:hypothetical protein